MISNELIEYYELLVKGQGPSPSEDNQHLRAYVVELQDFGKNEPYSGSYDTVLVWRSAAV
jgi:hypothetical protein